MEELERTGSSPTTLPLGERLRRAPEWLLHGLRRRLALARLARRGGASSVLFVCAGNLYRSPFAAALLPALLPGPFRKSVRCSSAGLLGRDWPIPPEAVAAAASRGVDLASHRAQMLTGAHIAAADLIVVMDPDQKREVCERFGRTRRDVLVLGDLDPEPIESRVIADPWDEPKHVLEASYDRIGRCMRELASAVIGLGGNRR